MRATAWQLYTAAGGGQSAPVFFTIDGTSVVIPGIPLHCNGFGGINSVLGVQRTGVYMGHRRVPVGCGRRRDREVEHAGSCGPGGQRRGPAGPSNAVLYQRVVATASNPGRWWVGSRSRRE